MTKTLHAHYTHGGRVSRPTLTITEPTAEQPRKFVDQFIVKGRREARAKAAELGATPWNF